MTPAVSIITPVHNGAAFLADAVESVMRQTVPDWELLLVDDNSTDDSLAIAERFAMQDSRVRLATTRPGRTGAAAARNFALTKASGDFVAFLDADDLFVSEKLQRELALADRYPEAKLISGAAHWWHPGREAADWIDAVRHVAPGPYDPPRLLRQLILLNRDEVPCTCAVLARRDAVQAVGGFEEQLALYEDQSLWVKLYANYPAYLGDHLTSVYRQHEASTSAKAIETGDYNRSRVHPARVAFLNWTSDYLGDEQRLDRKTRSAMRIAKAIVSGDRTSLSFGERLSSLGLKAERMKRRAASKLRHLRGSSRRVPTGRCVHD